MAKTKKENKSLSSQENNPLNSKVNIPIQSNDCPKKDKDGNCLVPGVYRDSEPIGGG